MGTTAYNKLRTCGHNMTPVKAPTYMGVSVVEQSFLPPDAWLALDADGKPVAGGGFGKYHLSNERSEDQ